MPRKTNRFRAIPSIILIGLATACAAPGQSGSADPQVSPTASLAPSQTFSLRPTATPAVEPTTPLPTPRPAPGRMTHANFGSHATVVADGLRLRDYASREFDPQVVLSAGQDLRILTGPIRTDGYQWYEVEVDSPDYRVGWVAAVPLDAGPTPPEDAWLIDIGPLRCPNAADVDTVLLARLTGYAINQCGVQVGEVSGLIDMCYEGPLTPFTYDPGWAWFSCLFLRDDPQTWYVSVHFPPNMADALPERGDIVTLSGALGLDTDRYGECTVRAGSDFPAEALSAERQRFRAACQRIFVVSSVRVDDHIELPEMY